MGTMMKLKTIVLLVTAACMTGYSPYDRSVEATATPTLQQLEIFNNDLEIFSEELFLPSTAVIIDAGHGGVDGGASYGDIMEKDINLAVAKKLYAVLMSRGIPAVLNRTNDYALSEENDWHRTSSRHLKDLSQRMGLTREIEHVVFVSIHVNAVSSARAHGPLVLYQRSVGESALLATNVQDHMNALYGTSKKVVAVKSFYLLKYVKSPAVLIELGFISNEHDRHRLTNQQEQTKIAISIADGISQYIWIN